MPQPSELLDTRLVVLLEPVVQQSGHVLEAVRTTAAGRRRVVRVVVDLPEHRTDSLDLDAVALVSRSVADALDAAAGVDVLGGSPYVLEVTSPGVDRPLTERRHWSRARGRLVTVPVRTAEGSPQELTGRVLAVDDDGVRLTTADGDRAVPWVALGTGRVQVEFTRPGTDDADDADDAEDTDDTDDTDDTETDEEV